jgi:hypothetical protein
MKRRARGALPKQASPNKSSCSLICVKADAEEHRCQVNGEVQDYS